jgi:hypothetical protein
MTGALERAAFKYLHGRVSTAGTGVALGVPDDAPALIAIGRARREMLPAQCCLAFPRPGWSRHRVLWEENGNNSNNKMAMTIYMTSLHVLSILRVLPS